MNICLFEKSEFEGNKIRVPFGDERVQHILRVLKKKEGGEIEAGIVNGESGKARILSLENDFAEFEFFPDGNGKELFPFDFLVGFPRPIQLKRLLRDVAGLGARRIVLCGTELGEKSYLDSNVVKDGSAQKMLFDGTVQAGSTHIPELFVFGTLFEAAEFLSGDESKIALDNRRASESLGNHIAQKKAASVAAAIGSERGWTERERDFFCKNGWTLCSMGNRILRTETAATVAGSIILNGMGFLN